ncbi:phosphate abc transporter permease protein psta [Mycoplasmopsis columbina SF7]|uniref:Phosphate abc transporter permease protein psta n=1 Tax=Mycoplasmopsis columbina SF7 TaxID=1037410 RepID=F9UKA7_9BACT|nr:ABC transporter permease subunit [Mycoplasmopsis columbina]EGV00112.1 phosphate abc transporter permease protein psta [Mycoplasmopsis columbina SF7]
MKTNFKNGNHEKLNKNFSIVILLIGLFLISSFLVFIVYKSFYSFKYYKSEIFTFTSNLNTAFSGGIFLPLLTTFIVAFFTLIISCPIGLKIAFWLNLRNKNHKIYQKSKFFLKVFNGLPSVIFGLFALMVISKWVQFIFRLNSGTNILNAILMLSIMAIPTITNNIIQTLEKVEIELKNSAKSLGLNTSKIAYKIVKKEIRKEIWSAYFLAFSKVMGESVALMFILKSQNYLNVYNKGFLGILNSSLKTIGALLPANFFAENGGDALRSLMFALGLILFIFIIFLNLLLTSLIGKKRKIKIRNLETLNLFFLKNIKNKKIINDFYNINKIFWELFSVLIFLIVGIWIMGDIVLNGLKSFFNENNTLVGNNGDSTLRALLNTLIIGFFALLIAFPISFFSVVYISEYAINKKIKNSFSSLIDAFTSVPSIIFGLFGYSVFISTFGFTAGGSQSHSLLAGILTISMFIIPFMIKSIQISFDSFDHNLKIAAQALGLSKAKIIYKLIFPKIWPKLINVLILMLAKITSESAPFLLTTGMTNSPILSLTTFGQTITTRMVVQLNSAASNAINIMYECALISLILFTSLFYVSDKIIPKISMFNFKRFIWAKK